LLGSGGLNSALIAAEQGTCYSMALFLGGRDDPAVVHAYQAQFRPSRTLRQPRWNVAVSVVCADTEEEAKRLDARYRNPYLVPNVVGDRAQCRASLQEIARRYETDEIIVLSLIPESQARLRSFQLLAEGLAARWK
jgi:alkanesulfonate monooxygenase SsuD/methylene tetrahydromethanopterin reductase-like flavin-dependent oxidoreductase (luciferase family)